MIYPDSKHFLELCRKGNLIPVYKEILGDLETPVSAYFKLAQKAKYAFLLESVEGEEKVARYSFMAKNPHLIFRCKHNKGAILRPHNKKMKTTHFRIEQNPLNYLRQILSQYRFVNLPELPRFCGGMVGYIAYDAVRFFENIPATTKDDLNLPDMVLLLATDLIIFDHMKHTIKIVSCVNIPSQATRDQKIAAYKKACRKVTKIAKQLTSQAKTLKAPGKKKAHKKMRSNFTPKAFESIVREAKKAIRAGEIIQVVLSQRFHIKLATTPFNVYRALRSVNPSPYMYHLHLDNLHIIGSSPELLVRCENNVIETRPIAGTRPRGKDEEEDEKLAKQLLADPKEKAEHIMLVDLGRNDLGRVAARGSVHVSEFMSIEKYSHVMHIVSNVKGILRKDKDIFDVLQAAFPAGTVSGAPKIRAMEIINQLENVHRGPYAGCIAYFSFSGNLDSCITIRTVVAKGQDAYIQAGAGIVADSNPVKEYRETVNKAKAQIRAIEMAHNLMQ